VHTHTFALDELPTGLRYARDRIDGAIKVVIRPQVVRGGTIGEPVHAFAEP
jgi:L-iditol 2-dehydrogenase